MKKLLLTLFVLTLSLSTSTVMADTAIVTCNKVQNAPSNSHILNTLYLAMKGQDVATVRVRLYNSRMRSLVATKLPAQDAPNFTSYAVQGFSAPMEVDNQILEGKTGLVHIGELDFSCSL